VPWLLGRGRGARRRRRRRRRTDGWDHGDRYSIYLLPTPWPRVRMPACAWQLWVWWTHSGRGSQAHSPRSPVAGWTPLGARVGCCLVSSAGAQAQNLTRALHVPCLLAAAGSAAPAGLLSLDGQGSFRRNGTEQRGGTRARARCHFYEPGYDRTRSICYCLHLKKSNSKCILLC